MKTFIFPLFLSLIMLIATPQLALAEVSKDEAASTAQQVHPGRVLSVKREGSAYRVKILSESGEVRVVLVEISSGKVISQ